MPRYDNIFLTDTGTTYNFTTPSSGGGGGANFPRRSNRQAHSDGLLAQFNEALIQFQNYTPEHVAAISYNTGTYVEFSGAEQCDLVTKSLEDSRQGITLQSIRDVVTQAEDGSEIITTKATVFIPAGKEKVFIKKISDFATQNTKPTEKNPNGNPKNNDLVSSIESISAAITISAFWIGRPADIPIDTPQWYELWIDTSNEDCNAVKQDAFAVLDALNIRHCNEDKVIEFPERLVILTFANRSNLLDVIKQGKKVAEIRKPAEPNAYFLDSSLAEQTEWADDLLSRTQFNDTGVAVCILDTGVNRNHSLIEPYMPSTGMTVETTWGASDDDGHGTNMAGVILYNDLRRYLLSSSPIPLNHTIESVKILGATVTTPNLYGAVTENAALLPEISAPTVKRVYCMAVSDADSSSNDGQPSSWSGAVDKISFDGQKRLLIISAGNVEQQMLQAYGYPNACLKKSVEDPAQAWNALTVGAYALDTAIQPSDVTRGYSAIAQTEELSPYSSTSASWKSQWPIKPELVCDGGNVASDGTNYIHGHDDLSKLTLSKDISRRLFSTIWATSAAAAQCSYIAAELMASYPDLHPETVRALLVHSARWTDAMKSQFGLPHTKAQGIKKLLRTCGYGVPDLSRAKDTLNNRVNMIIEGEMQPYEKAQGSSIPKMKEMHLHSLPWPDAILQELENTGVKVRITLSYFIEPGPGQKGWKNKYRYASCGLRFELKRPNETVSQFQQRVNKAMRDEDYENTTTTENNWYLGEKNRNSGSIHSDVWIDTAINLAQCNSISVFPVVGWWRERTTLKKYNSRVRYSLVVTLETPEERVDLYTPIMTKIASRIPVSIERNTSQ